MDGGHSPVLLELRNQPAWALPSRVSRSRLPDYPCSSSRDLNALDKWKTLQQRYMDIPAMHIPLIVLAPFRCCLILPCRSLFVWRVVGSLQARGARLLGRSLSSPACLLAAISTTTVIWIVPVAFAYVKVRPGIVPIALGKTCSVSVSPKWRNCWTSPKQQETCLRFLYQWRHRQTRGEGEGTCCYSRKPRISQLAKVAAAGGAASFGQDLRFADVIQVRNREGAKRKQPFGVHWNKRG